MRAVRGVKGVKGMRGVKGMKGVKGVRGVKGVKGVKGMNGMRVVKGVRGVKGVKGMRGVLGGKSIIHTMCIVESTMKYTLEYVLSKNRYCILNTLESGIRFLLAHFDIYMHLFPSTF